METSVRILVVEDNEDEAFLLIHELKRAGYEVIWQRVETAEDMRACLETGNWDVITSDHKMPRFSAPEALQLAKEVAPEIPVIIVSGEIDLELAVNLLKNGALDYVQKDKMPLVVPSIGNALEIVKKRREHVYTEDDVRVITDRLIVATRTSGIGIWEHSPLTNLSSIDDTTCRIFGYDSPQNGNPESLFGAQVLKEDYSKFSAIFDKEIQKTRSYETEFRITHNDGSIRHIRTSTFFDKNADGDLVRMLGTVQDITQLRQAIQSHRSIESSFKALFENCGDAIFILEAEAPSQGTIVSVNPVGAAMHGYKVEELIGRSIKSLNSEKTVDKVDEWFSATLANKSPRFVTEHVRKDGTTFRLDVVTALIESEDRKLALAIQRDLTSTEERDHEAQFLSDRLELLAQITSTVVGEVSLKDQAQSLCEDVLKTFSADACIIRLLDGENLQVLACSGVTENEIVPSLPANYGIGDEILRTGQPLSIASIPDSKFAAYMPKVEDQATALRRFMFVSYAGAPIKVQNRVLGVIGIYSMDEVRDFTVVDLNHLQIAADHIASSIENFRLYAEAQEQHRVLEEEIRVRRETEEQLRTNEQLLEERVRQRTAQLEEANRELEAFSYSVSHDLRSPIRAIQGFSTLLMKDYESVLDEEGLDSLRRVIGASRRLNDLIDSMLSLSRIAREELHLSTANLADIAQDVLFDLRTRHPERKVDMAIQPNMTVKCDPKLLQIALTNLLDNAWKFTQYKPDAHIECGETKEDGERVFYIRDNGAGFDMSQAGRLFAPFQRLHSESEFEGTGVGLAIVQRVIQRHGGRLWANSTPGNGTTFSFTLGSER